VLTHYINAYFSEMSEIAARHGGTVDKFIGDAMMVFFGDPESRGSEQDALACVRMAYEMQQRLSELHLQWETEGLQHPFHTRIGINTGYCNVGNFGSEQRLSYTIIGGEVNIAQRLESQSEPGGILLSYETYAHVQDMVQVQEREAIRLKGIARDIKAYAIQGRLVADAARLSLHNPAGIAIDLNARQMDPQSRSQVAQELRALASRLETELPAQG